MQHTICGCRSMQPISCTMWLMCRTNKATSNARRLSKSRMMCVQNFVCRGVVNCMQLELKVRNLVRHSQSQGENS
jgi:hypothetical protein